jgi:hydrophobic/amphiphilic exporter-1 (mainly G- bacteria), HAE1 family
VLFLACSADALFSMAIRLSWFGMSLIFVFLILDAALEGARLRLRPILMTSFAFIFGLMPLWFATGSGAVARRVLGSTVIGGMIAASAIAIFLIPVTFYVIERLFAGRKEKTAQQVSQTPPQPVPAIDA